MRTCGWQIRGFGQVDGASEEEYRHCIGWGENRNKSSKVLILQAFKNIFIGFWTPDSIGKTPSWTNPYFTPTPKRSNCSTTHFPSPAPAHLSQLHPRSRLRCTNRAPRISGSNGQIQTHLTYQIINIFLQHACTQRKYSIQAYNLSPLPAPSHISPLEIQRQSTSLPIKKMLGMICTQRHLVLETACL